MGERYDYEEAVKNDVRQYLEEHWEKGRKIAYEDALALHGDMLESDGVTGNGSGSYTFNAWRAEEYVCHNLDLLGEALDEYGVDGKTLREKMGGEWADVVIRCYVLSRVEQDVFDEWNDDCGEEKDEDEE